MKHVLSLVLTAALFAALFGCSKPPKEPSSRRTPQQLMSAVSPAQVDAARANFPKLRAGMSGEEVFSALGLDPRTEYASSAQGPADRKRIDVMLRQGDLLELVMDCRNRPNKLIAARLGTAVWPDAATWGRIDKENYTVPRPALGDPARQKTVEETLSKLSAKIQETARSRKDAALAALVESHGLAKLKPAQLDPQEKEQRLQSLGWDIYQLSFTNKNAAAIAREFKIGVRSPQQP